MKDTKYLVRRIRTEDGDMFGIFKEKEEPPLYRVFNTKYARLIIELLRLEEHGTVDKDSIRDEIMKTISIDRGQHNGKTNRKC